MSRSFFLLCLTLAVALSSRPEAARADFKATTTTPYPGVVHTVYVDASVPLRVHLVTVDASAQEIHFYATQSGERGQTVSDFANCKKGVSGCVVSDVAVNGDLFTPLGFVPNGLAIGGAAAWPDAMMDNATEGFLAFGRPGDVNALYLSAPSAVEAPPQAIAVEGAIGGRALLVQGGQPLSSYDAADPTEPFRAAPRTAIGVDAAGHKLYLAVVDGDQAASAGLTDEGLADFLAAQGVAEAIELDGGGSSALYIRKEGGLVSSPSDGVERPVANQLGLSYGASTHFSVVGFVCPGKFCSNTTTPMALANATVTVDGQVATWTDGHELYQVNNVSPHYVCAHASAPGYISGTQCRQITVADVQSMGSTQYLSLVLYPGSDPPPDMAEPPDLAHPPRDLAGAPDLSVSDGGGPAVDAGPGGGGSGCALIAGRPNGAGLALIAVVFVGAAILRRRHERQA
ncbi:MAG TPA: phosphodiester glycosidase family protein [Polyangia bacterium]